MVSLFGRVLADGLHLSYTVARQADGALVPRTHGAFASGALVEGLWLDLSLVDPSDLHVGGVDLDDRSTGRWRLVAAPGHRPDGLGLLLEVVEVGLQEALKGSEAHLSSREDTLVVAAEELSEPLDVVEVWLRAQLFRDLGGLVQLDAADAPVPRASSEVEGALLPGRFARVLFAVAVGLARAG